jgi:hypothetical protein
MVAAFKKRKGARPASRLESTTLRGFGGGWNSIDEDLSMPPKFQVALVNFHRTSSGSQAVRYGSNFNADIKSVRNSPIVDGYYLQWPQYRCDRAAMYSLLTKLEQRLRRYGTQPLQRHSRSTFSRDLLLRKLALFLSEYSRYSQRGRTSR